jgi:membrane protein implicated in regulation of membrane protease activity
MLENPCTNLTRTSSYMKGGINMELIWGVLFVIFVVVEIITVQLISVWFACGSLVALVCTHFFGINTMTQLVIFIVTSAVLLAVTFPFIRKRVSKDFIATNNDLDIGQCATVIEEINPDKHTGRATLNGVDWIAVSYDKSTVIPAGSIVTVKKVEGAKLIVVLKEEKITTDKIHT